VWRRLGSFGRFGGEEFGVLYTDTSSEQCSVAMECLRSAVAAFDWAEIAPGLSVSFSADITSNVASDTTEKMTKRVDTALYQAKHEGRNRVV